MQPVRTPRPATRAAVLSEIKTQCGPVNTLMPSDAYTLYASVNNAIIRTDNGLSPIRRQAIIKTNARLLSIGTNFSEAWVKIWTLSFKKMRFEMPSSKCRHFVSATLRPRHESRHFADDILEYISLNGSSLFSNKISSKFVPCGLVDDKLSVQILIWRGTRSRWFETQSIFLSKHYQ